MNRTIFVDLDGSLIKTDLFAESILKLIAKKPLAIFELLTWLFKSRAYAKAMLARRVPIDYSLLPYNADVLNWLMDRKAEGCKIVLATASHWRHARGVMKHLEVIDDVIASNAKTNLKSEVKRDAVLAYSDASPSAYIGDSKSDLAIWSVCEEIVAVAPSGGLSRKVKALKPSENIHTLESTDSQLTQFLKEMRLHQWAKNALVFVPLLTAHQYFNPSSIVAAVIGFICFGLCASGAYFLNDALDLDADRRHHRKKDRPLASGRLWIGNGVLGAITLPLVGFGLALMALPLGFVIVLGCYFVATNAYSFYLKRKATVDVITLALLYTVRVVGGAFAIGVALSTWLTAFVVFIFTSLAYLKRYIEVAFVDDRVPGRDYFHSDSETTFVLGASSGTASIFVMAMYISSPDVTVHYNHPEALWIICLMLLYWINRVWTRARRNEIHDDPVVFALKDRKSYLVGAIVGFSVLLAKYV